MVEAMYNAGGADMKHEAPSVSAFCSTFVNGEDVEDKFYEAIRDTRMIGFREGVKAAITLFAELG